MNQKHRSIVEDLAQQLAELSGSNLSRRRQISQKPCGPVFETGEKNLLAFASNDYLGLANAPELVEAVREAAQVWGVGAGASHLVSGHFTVHEALEQRLAAFTGFEASLHFSTGYLANLAVMPALLRRGDAIFADRLNHASLVDGALLSRADLHRYPHLDLKALEAALSASHAPRKLIVSDAVFSMDGDIAPLAELLALAEAFDAWLLIDDAHGFGLLGPQGRGALAEAGLASPRLILMGTLGKAAGVAGAFVAASSQVIEWLVQKARPYIFSTASPPLLAATLLKAIDLIERDEKRREMLFAHIARLQDGLSLKRFRLLPSRTAIQPVLVGNNESALLASARLREQGFYVPAIRPPTVPAGTARLRISLSAAHSEDDVQRLVEVLNELDKELA